jgi:hypothetical protein
MTGQSVERSDEDGWLFGTLKAIFAYEMTLAEWIGLAAILAAPYLVVGVVWSGFHAENQDILWFLKSTVTWPWLMSSGVLCLT